MNDLKLVHVYTAPDKMTAELLKGLLESNNIKTLIQGNSGPEGGFMGTYGVSAPINPWLIYVSEENTPSAKEILLDFDKSK